jgi:SAM-dependent methyltransferase
MLNGLNRKMADFYGKMAQREAYQVMIDEAHTSEGDPVNVLTDLMVECIIGQSFYNILEVGCGSGKIYQQLTSKGFKGKYTGIEMAPPVIEQNKKNFPEAAWHANSVYDFCNNQKTYDCCIAFFVLEHLIYPEVALLKMLGTLKEGGSLLLVFPDFSFSGIFPSQKIGLKHGKGAKEKLLNFKFADALISLLEARIMASRLKHVRKYFGEFVINSNPFCLSKECTQLTPDVDAIYISNRQEVEDWAIKLGHEVAYPYGNKNQMLYNPLMQIKNSMQQ